MFILTVCFYWFLLCGVYQVNNVKLSSNFINCRNKIREAYCHHHKGLINELPPST
ncbi:hypothetical protein HMPREF0880_00457 [Yokenella regensburgei ATCC 43003]|nr:hypothetical protein HMPREF0880_00457 [Yokenella regensburgei ATCC 43003]